MEVSVGKNAKYIALTALAIILLTVISGLLYLRGFDQYRRSRPGHPAPVFAEIITPDHDSSWPMNMPIPIRAAAHSDQPLASMELWVNGVLVAADSPDDSTPGSSSTRQWEWIPGEEGIYSLTLRVTDQNGLTTHSSPVFIKATEPVGFSYLVVVDEDDTIEAIAAEFEVDPDTIYSGNPSLEPGIEPLPETELFIPAEPYIPEPAVHVPPMPVSSGAGSSTDLQDLQAGSPADGSEIAEVPAEEVPVPDDPLPDDPLPDDPPPDLSEILQNPDTVSPIMGVSPPPVPKGSGPAAPTAHAIIWNTCDILITWEDNSEDEDGFLIYTSDVQNPHFEILADLPADKTVYQETMWGQRTFYVSAYNQHGETPGDPISISNLDPKCTGAAYMEGGVSVEGGVVQIPDFIQLAYLYASFNGEDWIRIPEDKDAFFPNDGTGYDINGVLIEHYRMSEKFETGFAHASLWADLEVWGWYAGRLYNLGTFKHYSTFSTLRACDLPGENACQHRFEELKEDIFIPAGTSFQEYQFYYYTALSSARTVPEAILWQISSQPFSDTDLYQPAGLVRSGIAQGNKASSGTFMIDFAHDETDQPQQHAGGVRGFFSRWKNLRRAISASLSNFNAAINNASIQAGSLPHGTYYVRFLPMAGSQISGKPSNSVVVNYGLREELFETGSAAHLPEIYNIEIVGWEPPVLVDRAKFGCITVDTVPEGNSIYENLYLGKTVCPEEVKGYERLNIWEQAQYIWVHQGRMVKQGINWVSDGYEWVKWQVTDFIADAIDIIPLVECGDKCRNYIKFALETTITSLTGFPPSLPNAEELIDRGLEGALEYGVEYAASRIGPECGDLCKDAIKGILTTAADEMNSALSDQGPACVSREVANAYNKEPLCLPAGVSGTPVRGSVYLPPVATVRITRTDTPAPGLTVEDMNRYQANISFGVQNMARQDEFIAICRYWNDYPNDREATVSNLRLGLKVLTPLNGEGWLPEVRNIPWLEQGESVEIPIAPRRAEYYVTRDVHQNATNEREERACSQYSFTDFDPDWHFMYLYYRGMTSINAEIQCEAEDGRMVPCGSADYEEVMNPYGPR